MTRTISTVAELETLPTGTVLRTQLGMLTEIITPFAGATGRVIRGSRGWITFDAAASQWAPLTVLHEPGQEPAYMVDIAKPTVKYGTNHASIHPHPYESDARIVKIHRRVFDEVPGQDVLNLIIRHPRPLPHRDTIAQAIANVDTAINDSPYAPEECMDIADAVIALLKDTQ